MCERLLQALEDTVGCMTCQSALQTAAQRNLLPEHNSATNRLCPGVIQQAPHTCLLLDETLDTVTPPYVAHEALLVRQLRSLHSFVLDGVVECSYAFQQVCLPVSGSVGILSEEPSRFVDACHVSLRLERLHGDMAAPEEDATAPLQSMRAYLASAWDLWTRVVYACVDMVPAEHATASRPPWVAQRLVKEAKALAQALRLPCASDVTIGRAFDTVLLLLTALAVSKGETRVNEGSWADLVALVERVRSRNAVVEADSLDAAWQEPVRGSALDNRGLEVADADAEFKAELLHAVQAPDSMAPWAGALEGQEDGERGAQLVQGGIQSDASELASRGQAMVAHLRSTGQL
jgi:hypothetical protein